MKPIAATDQPMPTMQPATKALPASQQLLNFTSAAGPELVLLRKITYQIDPRSGICSAAENQAPIFLSEKLHDALSDGRAGACKEVSEIRATQSGTDIVLRGHARSAEPVTKTVVGMRVGAFKYSALVSGNRFASVRNGEVRFSEAQAFQEMPLRYELAYGGRDEKLLAELYGECEMRLGAQTWHRGRAFGHDVFPGLVPVVYARNPVGLGYSAQADIALLDGLRLPNIELESQALTPGTLLNPRAENWLMRQAVAGFDFMDVRFFPRSAMLGLPPLAAPPAWSTATEVSLGLIPTDYLAGDLLAHEPSAGGSPIHSDAGRVAAPGLRAPRLGGAESLRLVGFFSDRPYLDLQLPGVKPAYVIGGSTRSESELFQVFVDTDQMRCELLWAARWQVSRPCTAQELPEVVADIKVEKIRVQEESST